jgi:hypothetical protein
LYVENGDNYLIGQVIIPVPLNRFVNIFSYSLCSMEGSAFGNEPYLNSTLIAGELFDGTTIRFRGFLSTSPLGPAKADDDLIPDPSPSSSPHQPGKAAPSLLDTLRSHISAQIEVLIRLAPHSGKMATPRYGAPWQPAERPLLAIATTSRGGLFSVNAQHQSGLRD